MTNEEILEKAIEKAIKGGIPSSGGYKKMIEDGMIVMLVVMGAYYNTIFSHDFAKAFWGNWECIYRKLMGVVPIPFEDATQRGSGVRIWQYHLQRMVLEEEPLKYLEKFLEE